MKTFQEYFESIGSSDLYKWDVNKLSKLFKVPEKDIEDAEYILGKLVIYYIDNDPKTHPAFRGQRVDQNISMSPSEVQKYRK